MVFATQKYNLDPLANRVATDSSLIRSLVHHMVTKSKINREECGRLRKQPAGVWG